MRERKNVLAVGILAIIFALGFRLRDAGALEKLHTWIETGRDVRSSASVEAVSPHYFESSVPDYPVKETLPVFSQEEGEGIRVTYGCKVSPDLEKLLMKPLNWDLTEEGSGVLILHTHATESYTPNGEGYEESSLFRTLDEGYNMLSLGDRVAEILEGKGIEAIHDRTLHDYPSYNGSYSHARKAIQKRLKENSSIQLILDLHRDAAEGPGGQLRTHAVVNGQPAAQLMFVLGTGVGGLGNQYWQENLALAEKLYVMLERQHPGITRPISLRGQRFNQDLQPNTLLVEIGAAGNTHEEALRAAEALAEAIAALGRGSAE